MIIDGKKLADQLLNKLKIEFQALGKKLTLAGIMVGDHPGSKKFLELKQKVAEQLGVDFHIISLPESLSTGDLSAEIKKISHRGSVHGIILELPLPVHINVQRVLDAIPPEKDVDVLSSMAQGTYFCGSRDVTPPATEAIRAIFESHQQEIQGKRAVVFGYGLLVGRQVAHWLAQCGATISIINEWTSNPQEISQQADIIVSGVGKAGLITADMVKPGAIVIDFGYENEEGKIRGDVNFDEVSIIASLITPVPGGVGPLVIAAIFKNLLSLNK